MRVRRTGAKKGQSVTWYVQAEGDEKELLQQGLWEEQAPTRKYINVLAWGFGSKADAEAAMERLEPRVEAALADLADDSADSCAEKPVESAVIPESVVSSVVELRSISGRLREVADQLYDVRLNRLAMEMADEVEILMHAVEVTGS
jgi:hypothetical protein